MQRALVEMQDREKILIGKKEKTSPAARTVYVSLDRADAFIEGAAPLPALSLEGRFSRVRV
jgi:ribosomal protein L11 methylase PrmA